MSRDVIHIGLLCLLWASFAAGLSWYCFQILRNVTYVTLADGRRQERRLPAAFRLLLTLAPNLTPLFRSPALEPVRTRLSARLVSAGYSGALSPEEFLALRVLVPLVLGVFAVAAIGILLSLVPGPAGAVLARRQFALSAIAVLWLAVYPVLWLRQVLRLRHKSIQRALPFVLDLLTLSVEAGMDFMSAIQRIVDRRHLDALGEEFVTVLREIQLGKTRRDALRDMARRIDQEDVRLVVNAMGQADELGVGIGSILRIQSDQMRSRRFERAEKLANEAPVKMLFPLVAFIFPAVFLVLLGPLILQIVRQL